MKVSMILHNILTIAIALVWFMNGLLCKILHLVPRHQMIVGRILGNEYAYIATKIIGLLELGMVVWIITGIKPKLCAGVQMGIVGLMVFIEIILTPDLLLFGKANAIPAIIFIGVVYYHAFVMHTLHKRKPYGKVSSL